MKRRELLAALAGSVFLAGSRALAQARWEQEAENTFRLRRGIGPQLMTEEEWRTHQQKMRTLTEQERHRYREEWHLQMMKRAQEKGLTVPTEPGPHGRGPGGKGSGGRGR